jgi:hypothetical protein
MVTSSIFSAARPSNAARCDIKGRRRVHCSSSQLIGDPLMQRCVQGGERRVRRSSPMGWTTSRHGPLKGFEYLLKTVNDESQQGDEKLDQSFSNTPQMSG